MPCPRPRHPRKNLKENLSSLLSAAAALNRPRAASDRPKTLKSLSRSGDSDALLQLADESPALTDNVFFLNTLINAFIVARCRASAAASFEYLKRRSDINLTSSSYSILLKLQFLLETDHESIYAVIGAMVKSGCRPDPITYSTVISGLCRVGRIEEARGVLDKMEEDKCPPTVRCYTSIVLGYCNEGRIDKAKSLIEEMGRCGCPSDTVTYTILIGALCKRRDFGEVETILGESKSNGWEPNEVTYNVYMNGLCKAGEVDEAFRKLDVMRERDLRPTVETLHILFDSLSSELSDGNLWKLVTLLSCDIDVFFYNTLVARLCQNGSWTAVCRLLAAMLKRGMMDVCTYTIMIKGLCKRKMLQEAKDIFCSMDRKEDIVVFNTLLLGLNIGGEFSEVHQLVKWVEKNTGKNFTFNGFTHSIVIDSYCREIRAREAVDYVFRVIRKGFSPSVITRPVSWLVKDGKQKEVLHLFDEMLGRGLVIPVCIFNSLIRSFCKQGLCRSRESYKFNIYFDRMVRISQRDGRPVPFDVEMHITTSIILILEFI